ncbi:hypothetical protein BGW80DRAFT_1264715 [Lactifluus volemus]|nr:hypothetical protein BGW80DRAFT_1264715 [Lactifluus volemus]
MAKADIKMMTDSLGADIEWGEWKDASRVCLAVGVAGDGELEKDDRPFEEATGIDCIVLGKDWFLEDANVVDRMPGLVFEPKFPFDISVGKGSGRENDRTVGPLVTGGVVEVVEPVFDGEDTQAGVELPAKTRRNSSKRLSANMIQMDARSEPLGHLQRKYEAASG